MGKDLSVWHRFTMNQHPITVSVVVPLKDEVDNIEGLARELITVLNGRPWPWECIWVDDGSTDGSLQLLKRLAREESRNRYLSFEKNAGQSAALWAGLRAAKGRILVSIDGDGQNDPADIPFLVEKILSGECDLINGYRQKRKDTVTRRLASRIANAFRNWTTGKTVRDVGCSTRALRRECLEYLPQFKGMHRFLPTLIAMQGFRIAEVPVNHRPRVGGKTKYTINNRLWVGLWDTFGVLWLRKRGFRYRIKEKSH
jgi:glycosyltransferase involved in cell wall biosynthesis